MIIHVGGVCWSDVERKRRRNRAFCEMVGTVFSDVSIVITRIRTRLEMCV